MSTQAIHVVVSWNRRENVSSPELSNLRRVVVHWDTPIEYESDIEGIEALLRASFQDEHLLKTGTNFIENRVQVVSWQPLLGETRPGSGQ